MSLRAKLVATIVAITTVATGAIGFLAYRATADRLRAEVETSLRQGVERLTVLVATGPPRGGAVPQSGATDRFVVRPRGLEEVVVQVLDGDGTPLGAGEVQLPVDDAARAVAAAGAGQAPLVTAGQPFPNASVPPADPSTFLEQEVVVGSEPYLVMTAPVPGSGAVRVARSLAESDRILESLRLTVLAAVVLVAGIAAAAGWFATARLFRRLEHLTEVAGEVERTGRLDVEVPQDGDDETGRLGAAFSSMLAALARSRDQQARLLQDAGHELRTPITSVRTNIAVLGRHDDLPPQTRQRLIADLEEEAGELTDLVNELVELATDAPDEPSTEVRLAPLAERVARRATRRSGRAVEVTADGSVVHGRSGALERALSNLVDNACKFSDPDSGPVELEIHDGCVLVCDRGRGIDDEDLPHVFDRFFRSPAARSRPGSGLGLAIVRDVAESHGGHVVARGRPGGGACVGFSLPTVGGGPATAVLTDL